MILIYSLYGLYEYGMSLNKIKKLVEKGVTLEDFIQNTEDFQVSIQKKNSKLYAEIIRIVPKLAEERVTNSVAQLAHEGISKIIIDNLIDLNISYKDIDTLTLEQFNEMNGSNKNSMFAKIRSAYEQLELQKGNKPKSLIMKSIKNILDGMSHKDYITIEDLVKKIPYSIENMELEPLLYELIEAKYIRIDGLSQIRRVFPKLDVYLQQDFSDKVIFIAYLKGNSVSDLASTYDYSRQGIYNILKRTVDKMPRFEEVYKYQEIFERFDINKSLFCSLFNEPQYLYVYLELVITRGEKSLLEDLFNIRFTEAQRKLILNHYNCFIDKNGDVKELTKINLFEAVVEQYAHHSVRDEDIIDKYNDYIVKQNLPSSLMSDVTSIRGLSGRCKNLIRGNSNQYRYYNYDILKQDVIHMLSSLLQLETGVYSMKKIFNENKSFMEEIDIRSEYELHNLYKQMVPLENITYTRMPEFVVGNISKKAFLLRLFQEYSPVNIDEFLEFIENLWGIRADSTRSFILSNLHEYLDGDTIKTDYVSLPTSDLVKLSSMLDRALYTVDEMVSICNKIIPDFEDHFINNMTLSKLGYTLRSSLILRNDFNSLDQYYRELILTKDYFYNEHLPIYSTQTFRSVLYNLEKNYDIFKVENDVYMTYSKLNHANINILDIVDFKDEVLSFVTDYEYFTFQTLCNHGFEHYLRDLGFEVAFYERLIWTFEEVRTVQTASGYIFKQTDNQFSLRDFLYDLILEKRVIDIYNLIEEIKYFYGITLEKSKVLYTLRETDIFFSEELYKLYTDKEDYYEEVFLKDE